ncbi:NUDIX domain-containing protein [Nocardioides lianchengensis]|uniref:ADP-ribose pyrophosphatase YjhB, NUDIX family n=1 Tax=Nocardioides lianchengensis TaxID=1045774 RepID=A0A1G7BUD8_9ACTN|nr:NUDIX hydrolase [Nocardioides lianchengensis]SDE30754.1 ADP-ribose pyrophosphatase YjhB, NUDIX family [Nocardioides lianchengensis]
MSASWASCARGHVHWGRRGAAGLLLADRGRVLLQLRARWAHQGGTWSIPGGAREAGESYADAALREAEEELGVDADAVDVRGSYVATCGGWTYETVLAVPLTGLALADRSESDGHRWVPAADVADLPLHPAFRAAWDDPAGALRAFVTPGG